MRDRERETKREAVRITDQKREKEREKYQRKKILQKNSCIEGFLQLKNSWRVFAVEAKFLRIRGPARPIWARGPSHVPNVTIRTAGFAFSSQPLRSYISIPGIHDGSSVVIFVTIPLR